jgi:hypothetical protein
MATFIRGYSCRGFLAVGSIHRRRRRMGEGWLIASVADWLDIPPACLDQSHQVQNRPVAYLHQQSDDFVLH